MTIVFLEGGRYFGIPLTTLLAGAGVGGLAVALAAQDSLNIRMFHWFHPPNYWEFLEFSEQLNLRIKREFEAEGIRFDPADQRDPAGTIGRGREI